MDAMLTDQGSANDAAGGAGRDTDDAEGIGRQALLFAMVAAAVAAWMVSGAGIVVLWMFCSSHLTTLASTPIVGAALLCWIGSIAYGLKRLSL